MGDGYARKGFLSGIITGNDCEKYVGCDEKGSLLSRGVCFGEVWILEKGTRMTQFWFISRSLSFPLTLRE